MFYIRPCFNPDRIFNKIEYYVLSDPCLEEDHKGCTGRDKFLYVTCKCECHIQDFYQ